MTLEQVLGHVPGDHRLVLPQGVAFAMIAGLPPDELYIDQRWELGDGQVQLPGYDIKILPPSGVIELAILWMVEAEMVDMILQIMQ